MDIAGIGIGEVVGAVGAIGGIFVKAKGNKLIKELRELMAAGKALKAEYDAAEADGDVSDEEVKKIGKKLGAFIDEADDVVAIGFKMFGKKKKN